MKDLIFDTGLVTYNINGKCEFSFNPTDSAEDGRGNAGNHQ